MVTQLPEAVKSRGRPKGSRVVRPIEAYDPATGKTVHRFANVAEAAEAGFTGVAIYLCLRGHVRTHGGLGWRRTGVCPGCGRPLEHQ